MNEVREKSLITVVDRAEVPEKRSSPKRIVMVLIGLSSGIGLAIAYAAWRALLASWRVRRDAAAGLSQSLG